MEWRNKSVQLYLKIKATEDPVESIKEDCREIILTALDLGWDGPPYNPIELATILNIKVTPNDDMEDARIIPVEKMGFEIQYNPYQISSRINFSIAHEIIHTFFPDCNEKIRNRDKDNEEDKELEILCNIGAAEILLPYGVFSVEVNGLSPTIENLLMLSDKYKASLEAIFLRYVDVYNKPCAILVCRFIKSDREIQIDFVKKNALLKVEIDKGDILPKESVAYECITPGWTSRAIEKWSQFKNEMNVYAIGLSNSRHLNQKRVGVFIIPKEIDSTIEKRKIRIEYGDATKPRGKGIKIIAQLVNTSAGLGIGFGKSLTKNYPIIKEKLQEWKSDKSTFLLGEVKLIKVSSDIYVCQMLAQTGLYSKTDNIPLSYSALRACLIKLSTVALNKSADVIMPQIGAGQAKGDWNVIQSLIYEELVLKGVEVSIYLLPGTIYNPKLKSNLTLFNEDSTWQQKKLF